MVMPKEQLCKYGAAEAWIASAIDGYIDLDVDQECRFFDQAWLRGGWGKRPREERLVMTGMSMPPLTHQQAFRVGQVVSYEPALMLLADLYDKVALSASSLTKHENGNRAIAVGMLAAAGLCDVSPLAVRLSAEGKDLVELLAKSEESVIMWEVKPSQRSKQD